MAQTVNPTFENCATESVRERREGDEVRTVEEWCFLVRIINRIEMELLIELLQKNGVKYMVRNASKNNPSRKVTGICMLGKDIYVSRAQLALAQLALQDYSLGADQATAEVEKVPAARRQQVSTANRHRHSLKKLIFALLIATVGYLVVFFIGMGIMNG